MPVLNQLEPTDPVGQLSQEEKDAVRRAQISAYTGPSFDADTVDKVSDNIPTPTARESNPYVTPEATVAGQLTSILEAGSPLQTLAESRANEEAQRRGVLSSSMAIGAAQKALYDSALQVATPDAATYSKANLQEQQAQHILDQTGFEGDIAGALKVIEGQIDRSEIAQQGQIQSELSAQDAEQRLTAQGQAEEEQMARLTAQLNSDDAINLRNNLTDLHKFDNQLAFDVGKLMEEVDAKAREEASQQFTELSKNFNNSIANLQAADINGAAKTEMIAQLTLEYRAQVQTIFDVYSQDITWEPIFPTSFVGSSNVDTGTSGTGDGTGGAGDGTGGTGDGTGGTGDGTGGPGPTPDPDVVDPGTGTVYNVGDQRADTYYYDGQGGWVHPNTWPTHPNNPANQGGGVLEPPPTEPPPSVIGDYDAQGNRWNGTAFVSPQQWATDPNNPDYVDPGNQGTSPTPGTIYDNGNVISINQWNDKYPNDQRNNDGTPVVAPPPFEPPPIPVVGDTNDNGQVFNGTNFVDPAVWAQDPSNPNYVAPLPNAPPVGTSVSTSDINTYGPLPAGQEYYEIPGGQSLVLNTSLPAVTKAYLGLQASLPAEELPYLDMQNNQTVLIYRPLLKDISDDYLTTTTWAPQGYEWVRSSQSTPGSERIAFALVPKI